MTSRVPMLFRLKDNNGREWTVAGYLNDDLITEDGKSIRLVDLPQPVVAIETKLVVDYPSDELEGTLQNLRKTMGYPEGAYLPSLGEATTRHLLHELVARAQGDLGVDGGILANDARHSLSLLDARVLDYRTVDS